jgi:hypothetical protein
MDKAPPVERFRIGLISAAVWKNEKMYSVTIRRSYKFEGQWKETDSLNYDDLLNAAKVLERAEAYITSQYVLNAAKDLQPADATSE